jgi:multiple sugar transport system substrate-binding protein
MRKSNLRMWFTTGCLVILTMGNLYAAGNQEAGEGEKKISITYKDSWAGLIEPVLEQFKQETGVEIEAYVAPAGMNFDEKVALDFAGGTASDIMLVDGYRLPEFAEAQYLYNIDDYLAEWDDWNSYFESMQKMVSFDGAHYGIPVDTDVRMLYYNKEVFRAAGISLPWQPSNWEEVMSTAMKIKKAAPDVEYPFFLTVGSKAGEATTMQGFYMVLLGADTVDEDKNRLRDWNAGKWIGKSEALLDTFEFYQDVFVNDELSLVDIYYSPDGSGERRRNMLQGNIGFYLGGSWDYAKMWKMVKDQYPTEKEFNDIIGWVAMPGSGKTGAPEVSCVSGGWAFAMNAKTENPDLSWSLLERILSTQNVGNWFSSIGKIATRKDVATLDIYKEDPYLAAITDLVAHTTTRDTYPGYSKVSAYIQSATEEIIDGKSPNEVMENYYNNLVLEFGEDQVITK